MPATMATLFFANFIYMNVINMHILSLASFVPFVLCTGISILESDKKSIS